MRVFHNKPTFDHEEVEAVTKVLRRGYVAMGSEVNCFEEEICDFLGLPHKHAIAVSCGTAALFLALWALNAKSRNVAFPAYVCSSLRHAVAMVGATESLVDISPRTPNIDLDKLYDKGADIAIIPHMYGLPCDLNNYSGPPLIEDCAQSLGAKINGIHTGLYGVIGIFSFYATKMMTTGGQGGVLISKDRTIVDRVRDYINFDQRRDDCKRFNFQMTDLSAAIGRVQLRKLPRFIVRRNEIYDEYKSSGINMIDATSSNVQPIRYRAIMNTNMACKIINNLERIGVRAIIPIQEWELLGSGSLFPNADNLSKSTVSLPIYPSMTDDDVKLVIKGVQNI